MDPVTYAILKKSGGGGGASSWGDLAGKPFESIGDVFTVDSDGVIDIPNATLSRRGLFEPYAGFYINSAGKVTVNFATASEMSARYGSSRAFEVKNLDYGVKIAMTDGVGAAWTDAEKTGAWKRLTSIKSAMDSVAVAGAQYYLGEQSTVDITMPATAEVGQEISVVFYSGSTAATLSVSGDTIGDVPVPAANQRVELNLLWDGDYWAIVSNVLDVPAEETV